MLSRRSLLQTFGMLLAGRALWSDNTDVHSAGGSKRAAVLFPSSLEPCVQAVDAFRGRVPQQLSLGLVDLNAPNAGAAMEQEIARHPSILVAVGSEAIQVLQERGFPGPAVSTMTLEADHLSMPQPVHARLCASIYLDIPLSTLLSELRKLFPDKTRVGIIRNPARRDLSAAQIRANAGDAGSLEIADCAAPHYLLPVFLSFRKKVDFVICLPDGSLYNSATARPLIVASLENRLPIVGFSPGFVRAGAAVAVYPDYHAIGEQTADLVRRWLESGDCAGRETPRKVTVAVNAKVLRMLGMDFEAGGRKDLVILR